MKKGGCALFGCAAVAGLLALAGLALLRLLPEESPAEPPVEAGAETAPSKARRPVSRDPDSYHLTFRFRDAEERPREVTCAIRRSDAVREKAGFGFVEKERVEALNRALREITAREAAAHGVERYFTIEVYGEGSIRWNWSYPAGTDRETVERIQAFHAWLEKDEPAAADAIQESFLHEHGMRVNGDTYTVDYARWARDASAPLADCFTALRDSGDGRSAARLAEFLNFFQDLRYELPPDVDGEGRKTLGFRVPTAVLVEGAGDCDSKSAAFCAFWRQLPARTLLVLVPEHALVAVEGKPGPDQKSIRLGNRTFILCEVAGPGRRRPGETEVSGSFEYVLIEPA